MSRIGPRLTGVGRPPGEAMGQVLCYQLNYIGELNNPVQGESVQHIDCTGFVTFLCTLRFVKDAVGMGCVRFVGVLYEVNKERLMWRPHPSVRDLISATEELVGFS